MYSIRNKIKLLLFFLMSAIFLTSCSSKNDEKNINLVNTKYVVSLSKDRVKDIGQLVNPLGAKLVFLSDSKDSKIISYEGENINSVNYYQDQLFMHSKRNNEYFTYSKEDGIKKEEFISIELDEDYRSGFWFVNQANEGLIKAANYGGYDGVYYSSIIYNGDNKDIEVILKDELLEGAIDTSKKIFITTYNVSNSKSGIIAINKDDGTYEKIYQDNSISYSDNFLSFDDKVFTYGYLESEDSLENEDIKTDIDNSSQYIGSSLFSINTDNFDYKSVDFIDDYILIMFDNAEGLNVYTEKQVLYTFDKDLNLISKKENNVNDFYKNFENQNYYLIKITSYDDIIAGLYLSSNFDGQKIAYIQEYNKKDLSNLNKYEIILENENDWYGELTDFVRIR